MTLKLFFPLKASHVPSYQMLKVHQSVVRDHVVKLVRETDKQFDNLTREQGNNTAVSLAPSGSSKDKWTTFTTATVNSPWFAIHLNTHEKEGITWAWPAILQAVMIDR